MVLVVESDVAGSHVHPAACSCLAAEEELADVEDQTAVLVPSPEKASEGAAGTACTAELAGWPHA